MPAVTYQQLHALLRDLGFADESVPDSHAAWRLPETDLVILHAVRQPDENATPVDLRKVRVMLDQRGVLDARDFDRFVAEGTLPHPGSARS